MPTDTHHALATHHLDHAAEMLRKIGGGAPIEVHATVGVGYAVLALIDEMEKANADKIDTGRGSTD